MARTSNMPAAKLPDVSLSSTLRQFPDKLHRESREQCRLATTMALAVGAIEKLANDSNVSLQLRERLRDKAIEYRRDAIEMFDRCMIATESTVTKLPPKQWTMRGNKVEFVPGDHDQWIYELT